LVRAKESRNARGVAEGVDPKYKVHTSCVHDKIRMRKAFKRQLRRVYGVVGTQQHTTTMERRIKPAAAASRAASFEYTRELTDEVTSTMPPAEYPVSATW
jgi:hypothetical protein